MLVKVPPTGHLLLRSLGPFQEYQMRNIFQRTESWFLLASSHPNMSHQESTMGKNQLRGILGPRRKRISKNLEIDVPIRDMH